MSNVSGNIHGSISILGHYCKILFREANMQAKPNIHTPPINQRALDTIPFMSAFTAGSREDGVKQLTKAPGEMLVDLMRKS
jgi:hypothetical protein